MKNSPLKFCLELFVPILLVMIYYIIADPFKIIYKYDSFFILEGVNYVDLDHDYVSVQNYDNHNAEYHYNSFILGNSRSRYYLVEHWKKHFDSTAVCYHLDASNETLKGMYLKLEYVSKYSPINNCLIVLDAMILKEPEVNKRAFVFYPAPQTTPEPDGIDFFLSGFKSFVNPRFLFAFTDMKLFGKSRNYWRTWNVFNFGYRKYDFRWNESQWPEKEDQIEKGTYYQKQVMDDYFKPRPEVVLPELPCISQKQEEILELILKIFIENNTDYRIVICSGYDQKALANEDYTILCSIFGEDRVYDFSGKNDYTEDYHNFYDNGHYRPHIADSIMLRVYSEPLQ